MDLNADESELSILKTHLIELEKKISRLTQKELHHYLHYKKQSHETCTKLFGHLQSLNAKAQSKDDTLMIDRSIFLKFIKTQSDANRLYKESNLGDDEESLHNLTSQTGQGELEQVFSRGTNPHSIGKHHFCLGQSNRLLSNVLHLPRLSLLLRQYDRFVDALISRLERFSRPEDKAEQVNTNHTEEEETAGEEPDSAGCAPSLLLRLLLLHTLTRYCKTEREQTQKKLCELNTRILRLQLAFPIHQMMLLCAPQQSKCRPSTSASSVASASSVDHVTPRCSCHPSITCMQTPPPPTLQQRFEPRIESILKRHHTSACRAAEFNDQTNNCEREATEAGVPALLLEQVDRLNERAVSMREHSLFKLRQMRAESAHSFKLCHEAFRPTLDSITRMRSKFVQQKHPASDNAEKFARLREAIEQISRCFAVHAKYPHSRAPLNDVICTTRKHIDVLADCEQWLPEIAQ